MKILPTTGFTFALWVVLLRQGVEAFHLIGLFDSQSVSYQAGGYKNHCQPF
jgi:hypothetical protein